MKTILKIIKYVAVLYGAALALVIIVTVLLELNSIFSGTSVSFQSSDGRWTDGEISGKRKFETVVTLFEAYKINCCVPEVTLQRVTPKPKGFTVKSLFDDYSEPKWQVPLSERPVQRTSDFEPECKARAMFPAEWTLANEKADAFIASLKVHN